MPPWVLPMLPDGVALTVAPHIQAGKTLGYRNTRYVHGFDVFRGVIVSVKSFGAMVVLVVINTEGHALVGFWQRQANLRQLENKVPGPCIRHELTHLAFAGPILHI